MRSPASVAFLLAALSSITLAAPHNPRPEKRKYYGPPANTNADRQAAVKEAFTFAWGGYYKYAFPHDELHPIANSYSDSRYINQILPRDL